MGAQSLPVSRPKRKFRRKCSGCNHGDAIHKVGFTSAPLTQHLSTLASKMGPVQRPEMVRDKKADGSTNCSGQDGFQ
jgi:hypothetical protein